MKKTRALVSSDSSVLGEGPKLPQGNHSHEGKVKSQQILAAEAPSGQDRSQLPWRCPKEKPLHLPFSP